MNKILLIVLGFILLVFAAGCGSTATGPGLSSEFSNSATPEQLSNLRKSYGLDKPVIQRLFDGDLFNQGDPIKMITTIPTPSTSSPARPIVPSPEVDQTTVQISQDSARMIVRTGDIQMVVNEIAGSLSTIKQISARYGGYVVSLQQWKEGDRNIGSISIRVLADQYDNAMADLRSLAKSVTNESTGSQDVTEEYTDLGAKSKNLEVTEAQLQKIMETAAKTEDILAIQRELTNVRGEIEQIKGRLQYLERSSSTSLINVRMEEAVLAIKFSADKISAGTDETIIFTPEVIGGFEPYNFFWDFGDGRTSFERNPSHVYKDTGNYPVGLKVTDDKGYTNTVIRNAYINVIASWKPGNVAHNAWGGFVVFGKAFVNVLIWLAAFSPLWIVVGALVWYFAFFRRRKKHIK
jgi:PKD repeat protein